MESDSSTAAAAAMANMPGFDGFLGQQKSAGLHLWGNRESMNMNSMVLTNIKQSPYFKHELLEMKTFHEVVDEIYYKVTHLEPWERGSRRTAGLTGASGGGLQVRGVGAGGIVSTAYCLLYKLFTLRLNRKQLQTLLDHPDSPYIRGLGFMYIRYCLDPKDYWQWFEPYMDDTEEIDVKAGGGCHITIGEMLRQFLTQLDWYSTLFPRIPVPIEKDLRARLQERSASLSAKQPQPSPASAAGAAAVVGDDGRAASASASADRGGRGRVGESDRSRSRDRASSHHKHQQQQQHRHRGHQDRRSRSRSRDHDRDRDRDRDRERDKDRGKDRDRDREEKHQRPKHQHHHHHHRDRVSGDKRDR